jgi:hypothetical protein
MNRAALAFLLLAPVAAGCGSSSSGSSKSTTAPITSTPVTPAPVTTVTDVHGELVSAPALTGGTALAFRADGATAAVEVIDTTALLAAGLHEGFTLVVSGQVSANAAGRTTLVDALRVTSFATDDLVSTGALQTGFPGVAFVDHAGTPYVPDGPLAAALLAQPLDRPLRVTGRVDTTRPPTQVGAFLIVTSFRAVTTISWRHTMPLLGHDAFLVDDLDGTGAYRVDAGMVRVPSFQVTRGEGRRLDATLLTDLQARVAAANLRALPTAFQPPQLYGDHPTETIRLADAQGAHEITVWAGATVPPALGDLMQALGAMPATVPTVRGLDQGDQSQIDTPEVTVARDATAWSALWGRHLGSRPNPPTIDFTHERGVGIFDGQRSSGGYTVAIETVVKIGPHLHLQVARTSPGPIATTVLTFPYHFVALDVVGAATADLYCEGVRQP